MLGLKTKYKKSRSRSAVGLSVGPTQLCLAHGFKRKESIYELLTYYEAPCQGLFADKTLISKVFKEKKISNKAPIRMMLNNQDYQLLITKKPYVAEANLAETLKAQLHDKIKYPLGESCLVSCPCLYPNLFSQEEQYLVVVAHQPWLLQVQALFKQQKLNLQAISIPEFNWSFWLGELLKKNTVKAGFLLYPLANAVRVILSIEQQLGVAGFLPKFSSQTMTEQQQSLFVLSLQQQIANSAQAFTELDLHLVPIYLFNDKNTPTLSHLLQQELSNPICLLNTHDVFNLDYDQKITLETGLTSISGALTDV